MKRLIIALMALVMMAPVYAANDNGLTKSQQKELNKKVKEFKKGKWSVMGTRTLDGALEAHYVKLNQLGEDGREVFERTARLRLDAFRHPARRGVERQLSRHIECRTRGDRLRVGADRLGGERRSDDFFLHTDSIHTKGVLPPPAQRHTLPDEKRKTTVCKDNG